MATPPNRPGRPAPAVAVAPLQHARRAPGWQDAPVQPSPLGRVGRIGRGVVRRVTRIDPLSWLPPPRLAPGERPVVGLVGFYGHGNYGDDLFLEVFREHLGRDFELRSLIVPGRQPLADRLGRGVRTSHAIVIGGGDLVVPWSTGSRYWEPSYLHRPVFVAGVGVPSWREPMPHVVKRLSAFFGDLHVRFIGARDPESTAWIEANLQPRIDVATSPDLVCGLTLPAAEKPPGRPILGVAVRSRSEPDDLSHVVRLCARATELGFRVRRIVLATGRVRTQDLEATARLGLDDTELVSTDDLDAISRAIGECTVLATMKFHGVVTATMYGVPAIAMMPTNKTRNFLRRIDRSDLVCAYSNPDLPGAIRTDLAPIPAETRDRLRADAVAHLADLHAAIGAAVGG